MAFPLPSSTSKLPEYLLAFNVANTQIVKIANRSVIASWLIWAVADWITYLAVVEMLNSSKRCRLVQNGLVKIATNENRAWNKKFIGALVSKSTHITAISILLLKVSGTARPGFLFM